MCAQVPIYRQRSFRVFVAIVLVVALMMAGYVEYQARVNNIHLQLGGSLYPVVADYVSWSKEEPFLPGQIPVVGELYSYRRPESASSGLAAKFHQWVSGGRLATKQCQDVSDGGLRWDTGSDDTWVLSSDVVGHVLEIYDSKYRRLSGSEAGRFQLLAERHYPRDSVARVGPNDDYYAIASGDNVTIYNMVGTQIRHFNGFELFGARIGFVLHNRESDLEHGFILYYPDTDLVLSPVDRDGGVLPGTVPLLRRQQ